MTHTFWGGVRLKGCKDARRSHTRIPEPPDRVYLTISPDSSPVVGKGDSVCVGQPVSDGENPVCASVSGTVETTDGGVVVIVNDLENRRYPELKPFGKKLSETDRGEVSDFIKRASVAGAGCVGMTVGQQLDKASDKLKYMIVNCAETEPGICSAYRLLCERPEAVVGGAKILLFALGLRRADFAVPTDSLNAANRIEEAAKRSELIKVIQVSPKYPAGLPAPLIYALTGKNLKPGKSPIDSGYAIFTPEECSAVYDFFVSGTPFVSRIVTVYGECVREPANFIVPFGTKISRLAEECGTSCDENVVLICGGLMRGRASSDNLETVGQGTSAVAVMALSKSKKKTSAPVCINCGRCADACPAGLEPNELARLSEKGLFDQCKKLGSASCISCGVCTYVCPGGTDCASLIRNANEGGRSE